MSGFFVIVVCLPFSKTTNTISQQNVSTVASALSDVYWLTTYDEQVGQGMVIYLIKTVGDNLG